ncbi:MAG TPA: CRISPR-associated helicase Cas3', partial [Gammaproteobacteria bacterium]|nr:CRISPR-associated helicase Cas3' [Gammaproteobacteria bacterium]
PFLLAATEEFVADNFVFPGISTDKSKEVSWWLAGFAVLCDWLGSNADYFPFRSTPVLLADYWKIALGQAERAVNKTELLPATPAPGLTLRQLIPAASNIAPTPLQTLSIEIALGDGPQLFIMEDVTGAGKTEAAILLAHRLMQVDLASGIYFALPTMATANAMYARLGDVYRQLYQNQTNPSLVLAHSARNLSDKFRQSLLPETHLPESAYDSSDEPPASVHCGQWLADSRKKALLAELGVGTIDQALLGILPSRHQSLRLLGLMHKVLVVDEVHACDAYMRPLLCNLLRAHAIAGGSSILLSATLPQSQRQQLLDAFTEGLKQPPQLLSSNAYPLLTHFNGETHGEYPLETRLSVCRHVQVDFVDDFQQVEQRLAASVARSQCACWSRNTVGDAREAYHKLKSQHPEWEIDLFHARFALSDRLAIEQRVLEGFGKDSNHEQRKGQVLIATQVVEQSLDLDFDHLITDLAPIDLIIQRAGRLHRHRRDTQGNRIGETDQRPEPTLTIHAPTWSDEPNADWFKSTFPRVQAVYEDHGQLWLTMKLLRENRGFRMPEDARALIEGVYGSDRKIPRGLCEKSNDSYANDRCKASVAHLNTLKLEAGYTTIDTANWWDEAITPTRLGEETTTVWLARWEIGKLKPFHEQAPFAWQQSSVAMRTALLAETAPLPEIPSGVIDSCRE